MEIFKDLKVVELANVLAGPAVGMFFAELGAKVIKVENSLTAGDITRQWKTTHESNKSSVSAYYASVNWNKEVIFADLTDLKEKEKVYSIIEEADIVISNYKPGDDKKLGMDYETISKINTNIVYGHITGFGIYNDRVAYDLVLQAETGFMSMNGTKESGPLKIPVAMIDILAAHQMKEALLIGLINRMKTNKGGYYTVSLYDAAISSLANQASNFLMTGVVPALAGSLHPNIAPYGEIFITKNKKKIILAIGSNKQFDNLCKVLGIPNIAKEKRFSENKERVLNRMELKKILQYEFKKKESDFLINEFHKRYVPAGEIKDLEEVFREEGSQKLILNDEFGKRIRTVIFTP